MTYDELCTLVGTIDKDAEKYMRTEAKELSSFFNGLFGISSVFKIS